MMDMEPINRISITDKVIERIRSHILSSGYNEGDKLPSENEYCQQLQVGRSTIREALRVLQTMGYITIEHGRGAFVRSLTPQSSSADRWFAENRYQLVDIYEVRRAIECASVRLAAKNITSGEMGQLRNIQEQFAYSASEPLELYNPNLLAQIDRSFHEKISEASHNPLLISITDQLNRALDVYRINAFSIASNRMNAVTPHNRIIEGLAQRDEALACDAMQKHLDISRCDYMEAAERANSRV